MNGPPTDDDGISGACRLGEHRHCHGNIDIKAGPGPAVPLLSCTCPCHRGRTVQARHT